MSEREITVSKAIEFGHILILPTATFGAVIKEVTPQGEMAHPIEVRLIYDTSWDWLKFH